MGCEQDAESGIAPVVGPDSGMNVQGVLREMHFDALAVDYDGTLATNGVVAPATIEALGRVRATGRRVFLVTGREVEDLQRIFPHLEMFDIVVAENGGVLFYPLNREIKMLHAAPPKSLIDEFRKREIRPLSEGHVVISTCEPNESMVLEVIKALGVEFKIVFNKGAVMVLP